MTRFIRWPGLAAFIALVAVGALIWVLAVDAMIQYTLEKAGTKAVGAKVELKSADLTLFPLGLELNGLQVTNPKKPMRNAIVAENIQMTFNTDHFLKGKKVVENLSASGVAFDRERAVSGALPEKEKTAAPEVSLDKKISSRLGELASLSVQNAREIIKEEKLRTIEEANALEKDIASARQRFQERMADLPDEATFADYRKRLKELRSQDKSSGGVMGTIGKIDKVRKLKADLESDLEALRRAKQDCTQTRGHLQERFQALQQAPARDADRLMEKYALSPAGIGNMSALIFGPGYSGWVETGLTWYLRLAPYLSGMAGSGKSETEPEPARGEGIDLVFDTRQAVPQYWIKSAHLSLEDASGSAGGTISGRIRDISSDQKILGRPLTFDFSGTGLRETGNLDINGHLDRTGPGKPEDRAKFTIRQYPLEDLSLLERDELAISMKSARIKTATGSIRIAGRTLDTDSRADNRADISADISAEMEAARFQVSSEQKDNWLSRALAEALGGIRTFALSAALEGSLSQPDIRIGSDIDDTLKNAFKQKLDQQMAGLKKELKEAISEKTGSRISEARSGLSGLEAIEETIQNRLKQGSAVLPG